MTNGKKDLTRIEDMDEFHHAPSDDGEESPPELPDLPAESSEFAFSDEALEATDFAESDDALETPAFADDETPSFDETPPEEASFRALPTDEDLAFPDVQESDLTFTSVATPPQEPKEMVTETIKMPPPVEAEPEEQQARSQVITLATYTPPPEEKLDPPQRITPEDMPYRPREDFAEVRSFAEKAVLADVVAESDPAFTVIAHGVKFSEDSDDILLVLRELKFPEDMMQQFQRQLERGSLLVPRVSEFTGIYLCHKLRRFRLNLQMGLSDKMHSPRSNDEVSSGLVSRRSLGQNQHHNFMFQDSLDDSRTIMLSTLAQLDGHAIERYLGVASEHAFLDSSMIEGEEVPDAISASYDELAQKLKGHALQHKANAVVGINYQLTPMPNEGHSMGHYRYKLTCTGNLVWVNRLSV